MSRRSSQTSDQTEVSHIAGRSFTIYVTREAHIPKETITEEDICTPMFTAALLKIAKTYNKNEKMEREIKETIPFTIAMKRIKYIGLLLLLLLSHVSRV